MELPSWGRTPRRDDRMDSDPADSLKSKPLPSPETSPLPDDHPAATTSQENPRPQQLNATRASEQTEAMAVETSPSDATGSASHPPKDGPEKAESVTEGIIAKLTRQDGKKNYIVSLPLFTRFCFY